MRIADEVATNTGGNAAFTASQNGVLIYRTGTFGGAADSQFMWIDRTGKQLGTAGEKGLYTNGFDLSPDGKQIAVSRVDRATIKPDIWLVDWARNLSTRFTFDPGIDQVPLWSPDGLRIAFDSDRKGSDNIFVKNVGGAGEEMPLIPSSDFQYPRAWSKDGRYLVYNFTPTAMPSAPRDIYALPLFGDRKPFPVVQSRFDERTSQFSFDGKWLAYQSNESGTWQAYVVSFPAGAQKHQISTKGGAQPRWRRDGKELYYLTLDGKLMAVDITAGAKIESGAPRLLFDTKLTADVVSNQYAVTPDGQRFLVLMPAAETTQAAPTPITVILNWTAARKK